MRILDMIAWILLIIGGLNWASVGIFNSNFIESMFGMATMATVLVYSLIGLSAIYAIFRWKTCCPSCKM